MSNIVIEGVVRVFMQDTLLYSCILNPSRTLKEYMMHKHKWSEAEYKEYFDEYVKFLSS